MLISNLVDIELATYQNGILTFYNEDARRFSNGEWLENLVHNTVREIQTSCQPYRIIHLMFRFIRNNRQRSQK